jgi:DNA invertase Pin-like site-specific DNA recombinase
MKRPRAVALYSRVSTVLQATDGASLESQERAIREYCARQGWPDPMAYIDAGRSAYKEAIKARPQFARLLADAEAGAIDAVVVWHLNRWARRTAVTLETLQRLERAGVSLISLSQNLDYSSAVGKLTITMLAGISQFESDEKSETAKRVHADLKAQGKWDGGSPPYGAMLDPDGRLTLDPTKADTLARMLELVATCSYHVAADQLNEAGIPPPGAVRRYVAGPPRGWWPTSLRNTVMGGAWLLAQPEPWPARYLAAATKPSPPPVARTRTIRLLTGLMRCHACNHAVVYATSGRHNTGIRLRCETPGCKLNYGRADRHEAAVLARMMALRPREQPQDAPGIDHRAWTALAERRKRYAAMFGKLEISEDEYEAARAELAAEEAALVAVGTPGRDFADLSRALPGLGALPPERANWYARMLILRVEMLSKTERRVVWMPDAAAAFDGCD